MLIPELCLADFSSGLMSHVSLCSWCFLMINLYTFGKHTHRSDVFSVHRTDTQCQFVSLMGMVKTVSTILIIHNYEVSCGRYFKIKYPVPH